jgi:hypothetical protein
MIGKLSPLDHSFDADPSIESAANACILGCVLREVACDCVSVGIATAWVASDGPDVDLLTPADDQLATVGSCHRDRYSRRGAGDGLR